MQYYARGVRPQYRTLCGITAAAARPEHRRICGITAASQRITTSLKNNMFRLHIWKTSIYCQHTKWTSTIKHPYEHPVSASDLAYARHVTQDGPSMSSWGPSYDGFMDMYGFVHIGAGVCPGFHQSTVCTEGVLYYNLHRAYII